MALSDACDKKQSVFSLSDFMGAEASRNVLGDFEDVDGDRGRLNRAISLHVLNHTVRLPHGSPREVSSLYRAFRFPHLSPSRGRLTSYLSAGSLLYIRGGSRIRARSLPALRGGSRGRSITRREILARAAGFTQLESDDFIQISEGRKIENSHELRIVTQSMGFEIRYVDVKIYLRLLRIIK